MIDRIVAVVDDSVILASEVELRMTPLRAQAAAIPDAGERERRLVQLGRQLLDSMIDDELVLQAGLAAKLTVEDKEVDLAIEYIMKEHNLDAEQLKVEMARQGMTRTTLRNDILRQRAIAHLVGPKVQVSEEEVKRRYEELSRRGNSVSAVDVSQIVIALPEHPTEQQQNEAKQKARAALDRVAAGEPFEQVAAAVSDDATTKPTGGRIGWLSPGTVIPEWEVVIFAMDKGEVRGPVPGERGLYLFFANDVKRTQQPPYADIKDKLAEELRRKALSKLAQTWIEDLRKKAYIEIK
jgi:parvulin-like peptidyl-prolyl isomerase